MTAETWLEIARTLPTGGKTRIQHCGPDRSMLISCSAKYWTWYCFRCRESGFVSKSSLTVGELASIRQKEKEFMQASANKSISLPKDLTNDLPSAEWAWLLRRGITDEIRERYRIAYSPGLRRVVFPVEREGRLEGFSARTINKEIKPKWYTHSSAALWWHSSSTQGVSDSRNWTVVEDIVSAIRLDFLGKAAIALMGTNLHDSIKTFLVSAPKPEFIAIWLDGDKAGDAARIKVQASLNHLGFYVKHVRTPEDPKMYDNEELVWKLHT